MKVSSLLTSLAVLLAPRRVFICAILWMQEKRPKWPHSAFCDTISTTEPPPPRPRKPVIPGQPAIPKPPPSAKGIHSITKAAVSKSGAHSCTKPALAACCTTSVQAGNQLNDSDFAFDCTHVF
ncbi:hypothetical protein Pst134EA_020876 [Puccinia striiformis f. sp. tritici]|uniref:hypothetical protein n=1 Tax=Puccinia striiformis f. sp. tritici TaxID=168172 RepID=UPI002008C023|nr:hypothetical protein Pst134EA_020876 [Puccinia striiformis f. sp. tritici]KAH9456970.1 hypothetical protein Pst134EA_020876 [Puccinia striiformis f. sp. tritici]